MRQGEPLAPSLRGFAPIINRDVQRLILGSFPSEASLAAGQYYAHPRNQFWPLVGALIGERLEALPYSTRLTRVLAHQLGIWDVLYACDRQGSGDASIRNHKANQFALLRRLAPAVTAVAFNGQTAGRYAPEFAAAGYEVAVLPSSSPAHAGRTYDQKLAIWRNWWIGSSHGAATGSVR
ncbi:MAG: DNA-deoxyinosine glycosylase [Burkholderiaceae bacterium]